MLIANSMVLMWSLRLRNPKMLFFSVIMYFLFSAAVIIASITAFIMACYVTADDTTNWMVGVTDPEMVSATQRTRALTLTRLRVSVARHTRLTLPSPALEHVERHLSPHSEHATRHCGAPREPRVAITHCVSC
jgi:hypothetical protein